MCGIWAFIDLLKKTSNYQQLFNDFMNMKARGPDMTSFQILKNLSVGFHRLAIMDPTFHANQPYILEDGERTIIFVCNGEIYDFKKLIKDHELPIYNNSDCMTIPQLYLKYVKHSSNGHNDINTFVRLFSNDIKGEYAFLLFEFDKLQNLKDVLAGRDTFGVRPLYVGLDNNESMMFSSEVKGMLSYKGTIKEFEPGTIMHYHLDDFNNVSYNKYYDFKNDFKNDFNTNFNTEEYYLKQVRDIVTTCVKRRLESDKPRAFLLSGGVDSSLICSISSKLLGQKIRTFCCGMKGGTDLKYARQVADHIGSNHTEVIFTPEQGLQKIRDVIRFTETWDTTSIRASIGQHIVCEYISKNTDAKVVLVGEGADECTGSYLTFWNAPSAEAFHDGVIEYLKEIHFYDGRRVDRNVSNFGLEARLPLLDPDFVKEYHSIPKEWRRPQYKGVEKYWLRAAFKDTNLLPDNCLFRKKEAFSDGMSSTEKSWFQILQEYIETQVSDEEFNDNKYKAVTKESYYYKKIFCELFGYERLDLIPHYWQPKFLSDGTVIDFNNKDFYIDPSARVLTSVYKKEDQDK
jgi:asparagine synthase (glutamine-hydrolysing)